MLSLGPARQMAGSGNIRHGLNFGVRSPLNDILTVYTSGSVCIIIYLPPVRIHSMVAIVEQGGRIW